MESLDLESNFIASLEDGTLAALRDTLTKLSFGGHNFVNGSVFEQISQLSELRMLNNDYQVLDMEQADGITSIPTGVFQKLNKLEKLLLPGCSLTVIHNDTFQGLTSLKELDLRINLINEVECGSFASTPNLRRLSLAGNFLNESLSCWWDGLEHLKELDLGWNELVTLPNEVFAALGPTLGILDLRHNTQLSEIEDDAFSGLSNLRRLNMSETSITELNNTLRHLPSLQELDLSNGKLSQIEENDLQTENLESLILRGNQLKTIPQNLVQGMKRLQKLDLSSNPWICDENTEKIVEEIELKYQEATVTDGYNFMLLNANETICDQPRRLRGQMITNMITDLFTSYNNSTDETEILLSMLTTTPDNAISFEDINASAITELLAKGGLIGDESKKDEHSQDPVTPARPLYDVNMKTELVNDTEHSNPISTIVAIGLLLLVSLAIMAAVILHIKVGLSFSVYDSKKG
ncbi:unnamed protein product [Gongylonema pulchrum]|uniref:LRRCT domain-containing protein n=1 Tax=Gongylonema pulchrum TaxID=637853 RepID=A0A3P6PJU8_9BILA|nr:unnamed protein product [Gongylonema pulchrum]